MRKILLGIMIASLYVSAQLVTNGSFEQGTADSVDGWSLSEGLGGVFTGKVPEGKRGVYVMGDGKDSVYWLSQSLPLEPGRTYRVNFKARKGDNKTKGMAVTGPVCCNVDITQMKEEWQSFGHVFVAPMNVSGESSRLRFGQWHALGRIEFDDVKLVPVQPIYHEEQGMVFGADEKLLVNEYVFNAQFGGEGRNHSRPLVRTSAGFNTHRWVFGKDSEVVYRHQINGRQQLSANLNVNVNYYLGGKLKVSVSKDGEKWQVLGEQEEKGQMSYKLPAELFPADEIFVRLSAESSRKVGAKDSDPGSFQVDTYKYTAPLSGGPTEITGATNYIEILADDPSMEIVVLDIGEGVPGGKNVMSVKVRNKGPRMMKMNPVVTLSRADEKPSSYESGEQVLRSGEERRLELVYEVPGCGAWNLQMELGMDSPYKIASSFQVSDFFDSSYGEMLSTADAKGAIWWASSGWKVPQKRALPQVTGTEISISAAQGESEAAQFVVRPENDTQLSSVAVSDLKGPGGAVISAGCVDVLRVYYHNVEIKTDRTGVLGMWPDALPPLKPGLALKAGLNQPVWVRVNVPKNAAAGMYNGAVTVKIGTDWTVVLPLKVEVFGFQLPDTMTCQTAFGFTAGTLWRYHKLTDAEQRRQVWEQYLDTLSKHHITPYNPTQLDNWTCKLIGNDNLWTGPARFEKANRKPGAYALHLVDQSKTGNVVERYGAQFPAEGKMTVKLGYKTQPGHSFVLSFGHYDGTETWMPGRNRDFHVQGDGTWQTFEATFDKYPAGAKTFSFNVHATRYTDAGELVGEVWIDSFRLTNDTTGKVLVNADFAPVDINKLSLQFDWSKWDAAMEKALSHYHFNTVRMHISGLGGGTFHSRTEPAFMGYAEGTPEYDKLFSQYMHEIESHLREKGWLDKSYIYWFDEPDAKDYEFVMNGFRKLKKYAPGIRRMLTEQVEDELLGGPNLWCPVSSNLNEALVPERKAQGEHFWWYVCTGPKAPYATLFIDHPATELRVWLWQTWNYDVEGILVWASNLWTSSCAYPDSLQNPYKDPMAWVSGYDTPRGTRRPWGNGDGRFIYPPEAAADGMQEKPVLDGPVDSIRFEMLRDGIEDYEYFAMLKRLLASKGGKLSARQKAEYEALLAVPVEVSKSMTEFTKNPAPMEAHRAKLAKAIAALGGK